MATKFSLEEWNQRDIDIDIIKDFTKEEADRWLKRHGYGPSMHAEAMVAWNALDKKVKVKPEVKIKVEVKPEVKIKVKPEVKKSDKKWF